MKKLKILLFILCGIFFISIVFSFLAMHDIFNDYLSKKVLISENILENTERLPDWTECKGEWNVLQIDLIIRIVFLLVVIVGLIKSN